jgi:hypothetical protein
MIFTHADSLEIRVNYAWSTQGFKGSYAEAGRVNSSGFWLLYHEFPLGPFPSGKYKLKSKINVTGGGVGSGKETCLFELVTCN